MSDPFPRVANQSLPFFLLGLLSLFADLDSPADLSDDFFESEEESDLLFLSASAAFL